MNVNQKALYALVLDYQWDSQDYQLTNFQNQLFGYFGNDDFCDLEEAIEQITLEVNGG